MRIDGRENDELRNLKIVRHYIKYPEGSVLIAYGLTKVICTATVTEDVPYFLKSGQKGWITAEYGMIPRSTPERVIRDYSKGKIAGRTQEIQRLIGRSLRVVVDLEKLGKRTIFIDCDVIQADGGTRTAAITGSFVALADAIGYLINKGMIEENPIKGFVAAVSVGVVNGEKMLDLCYEEDSKAEVDMNIVMTDSEKFVEIQGTAEKIPFSKNDMTDLLKLASKGAKEIISTQKKVLSKKVL
ncbi:MAG: ribonuclease PH [Candidatus Firestonebacteria bacterium]